MRVRLVAAALAVVTLAAWDARAWCRTSVCDASRTGARCVPERPSDCGIPLAWRAECIGYSLQEDASFRVTLETARTIVRSAFDTWMQADCGEGTPRIRVDEMTPVSCALHEYNQEVGNANAIIFRDDGWPYAAAGSTLALTTVTYNLDTGEIYDADMEINSKDVDFTTTDGNVNFDLLSILTHEAGHFLGLSHTTTPMATMFPDYEPKSAFLRSLEEDDIAAICATYPPGAPIDPACVPTLRHGFSTECGSDQPPPEEDEGCCAVAPGAPRRGALAAAAALGSALLLAVRARRRRPRT